MAEHDPCLRAHVVPGRESRRVIPSRAGLLSVRTLSVRTLEHAVELFRLLPKAALAILPDTNHLQLVGRWPVPMIEAFLDAPMPQPRAAAPRP